MEVSILRCLVVRLPGLSLAGPNYSVSQRCRQGWLPSFDKSLARLGPSLSLVLAEPQLAKSESMKKIHIHPTSGGRENFMGTGRLATGSVGRKRKTKPALHGHFLFLTIYFEAPVFFLHVNTIRVASARTQA